MYQMQNFKKWFSNFFTCLPLHVSVFCYSIYNQSEQSNDKDVYNNLDWIWQKQNNLDILSRNARPS